MFSLKCIQTKESSPCLFLQPQVVPGWQQKYVSVFQGVCRLCGSLWQWEGRTPEEELAYTHPQLTHCRWQCRLRQCKYIQEFILSQYEYSMKEEELEQEEHVHTPPTTTRLRLTTKHHKTLPRNDTIRSSSSVLHVLQWLQSHAVLPLLVVEHSTM